MLYKMRHLLGCSAAWAFFWMACFTPSLAALEPAKRVLLLESMDIPLVRESSLALKAHLLQAQGSTFPAVSLKVLNAQGDWKKARALLESELSDQPPDLVITSATLASTVAKELLQGKKIPQIFLNVSDPVGTGLVPAIDQPSGAEITGRVYSIAPEAKLKILMRLVPKDRLKRPLRLGIVHSSYPAAREDVLRLRRAAAALPQIQILAREIPYQEMPKKLPQMMASAKVELDRLQGQVDYLWVATGPMAEDRPYYDLLMGYKKTPLIFGINMIGCQAGALYCVVASPEAAGWEVGEMALRALDGEPVGQMLVRAPEKVLLAFNLNQAVMVGWVPPPDLLQLAMGHLYR
ncbi:MAG: ABC transporter substrate binding protein [bacterium]|nr:ABC transporter substrate binding protein [bacterium]